MKQERLVYQRKDGRWEARYKKGISSEGKTLYGAVYGSSREEVIQKRSIITKEKSDVMPILPTHLNLLILGAGSHGRNIKEIAESLRIFKKISFLDDKVTGEDILGKCKDALDFRGEYGCAFVAIGDNEMRKKYARFLKERKFILPNIISPAATVSPKAKLGEGIAILPQSTVGETEIGDFCILSSNSLVNIDCRVGSFCHVDCGGIILKDSRVPDGTWVKSGEIFSNNGVVNTIPIMDDIKAV